MAKEKKEEKEESVIKDIDVENIEKEESSELVIPDNMMMIEKEKLDTLLIRNEQWREETMLLRSEKKEMVNDLFVVIAQFEHIKDTLGIDEKNGMGIATMHKGWRIVQEMVLDEKAPEFVSKEFMNVFAKYNDVYQKEKERQEKVIKIDSKPRTIEEQKKIEADGKK